MNILARLFGNHTAKPVSRQTNSEPESKSNRVDGRVISQKASESSRAAQAGHDASPPKPSVEGSTHTVEPITEIPWDYIKKASSDNDTFFNENREPLPELYQRIKEKGRDPVVLLVAYNQEKWRALLALLYNGADNMLFTPESITQKKAAFGNNGHCEVYVAPEVNGRAMQVGVYGLERDWLISQFYWVKGIPPMFVDLIKREMEPDGNFTIVVLAAGGMQVRHLPRPAPQLADVNAGGVQQSEVGES